MAAATGVFKLLEGAKVRVLLVKLEGAMDSLKVAFTVLLMHTPEMSLAGLTKLTVGGVVSSDWAVLKVQTFGASMALPAKSIAAVLMVAVNAVSLAKIVVGVKMAVRAPTA
jgi:hypothetical protein